MNTNKRQKVEVTASVQKDDAQTRRWRTRQPTLIESVNLSLERKLRIVCAEHLAAEEDF